MRLKRRYIFPTIFFIVSLYACSDSNRTNVIIDGSDDDSGLLPDSCSNLSQASASLLNTPVQNFERDSVTLWDGVLGGKSVVVSRERLDNRVVIDTDAVRTHIFQDHMLLSLNADIKRGNLVLVFYDVLKNIPSGRNLPALRYGLDIIKISFNNMGESRWEGIEIGNVDADFYVGTTDHSIRVCSIDRCAVLLDSGTHAIEALSDNYALEIIELEQIDGSMHGLMRRKEHQPKIGEVQLHDPTYIYKKWVSEDPTLIKEFYQEIVPGDCVPLLGNIRSGETYACSDSMGDIGDLFIHELGRRRFDGYLDFGFNNYEGRVVWSQAYYLRGFIDALNFEAYFLKPESGSAMSCRAKNEIDSLVRTILDENTYLYSRRYSFSRTDSLFALHLGRALHVLKDWSLADPNGDNDQLFAAISLIETDMSQLNETVEELSVEMFGVEQLKTLKYKRGIDFWADGVNVPHNYNSGYAMALLADPFTLISHEAIPLIETISKSTNLLESTTWDYWAGRGQEGWVESDDISTNTPVWAGDKVNEFAAHITYRSMDLEALLVACSSQSQTQLGDEFCASVFEHSKFLIRSGQVLPYLNRYLCEIDECVALDDNVARRFARSAYAYETHSQLWALQSLYSLQIN